MKKYLKSIAAILVLLMSMATFAACGNDTANTSNTNSDKGAVAKKVFAEPTVNTKKMITQTGYWSKPPGYNGNYFNNDGPSQEAPYVFERLCFIARPGLAKLNLLLADKMENIGDTTVVTLKKNVKWHDGEAFTSKDIWAFYQLVSTQSEKYLDSVEMKDDNTVVFNWTKPAVNDEMKLKLLSCDWNGTVPYHIYKKYVDVAADIYSKCKKNTETNKVMKYNFVISKDDQKKIDNNYKAFVNAGPKVPIGTGPFKHLSVDDNQLVIVKNPDYWDADKIKFDKLKFIYAPADNSQYYAMLRNGDLDRDEGVYTKDIAQSMLQNPDLVNFKYLDLCSVGITYNTRKAPLNDLKFRQALTYIIDRSKVREISSYYGKDYTNISSLGFSPSMMKESLVDDLKLTDYTRSEEKATALLKELGWTKQADGVWADKNGKKPNFMIGVDVANDVQLNGDQVIAEQLTKFGIPTKVKGVDSTIFYEHAKAGDFDIVGSSLDQAWNMRDAWDALDYSYGWEYDFAGKPTKTPEDRTITGYDGKQYNYQDLLNKYPRTNDPLERKKIVSNLAFALNEQCISVGMYQGVWGVTINTKSVDGNFPATDKFDKYQRDLPQFYDENPQLNDDIVMLGDAFYRSTKGYWPK